MDAPLVVAGLALGVAAAPHCVLMCGAPCAALSRGGRVDGALFQLGRLAGYAAGGAVAAASVGALAAWSQNSPVLRPLWTLLHLALLALGLWWLARGRPPPWLQRDKSIVPVQFAGRRAPRWRAALAGLVWVAWPCAAVQSALLLAALADSAPAGALVMAAFALASMPALVAAPWAWRRLQAVGGLRAGQVHALGYRIAGAGLLLASGWALTHGLWERVAAWCFS